MKEIKEITNICKNVFYDHENNVFFCELCGRATFSTKAQAVGHLSQCPKKDSVNRPPPTTTTTTSTPPPYTMTLPPLKLDMARANASQERLLALYEKRLARIEERDSILTNELPHIQAVRQMGFLGITNQDWLIIGVVAFVAYMFGHSSSCKCDVSAGGSPRKRLGTTIQDKVTDRAINYGLNKLFK
jgi:hypothetical protein